jgi:hypothetical protein
MTELRLDGKTEDGSHLSLVDTDGNNYSLRISDTLRATVNQPRLTSVPAIDAVETISVKEIQRRLRAGDSFEQIAREGQTTVDKVERFSGPIMQEREYILENARNLIMRKDIHRIDLTFREVVLAKLAARGVDTDEVSWNTWRQPDGTWHIELHYPNRDGNGIATWNFDTSRRTINPTDDNGAWLIDEDAPVRVIEPGYISAEPTHPSRAEVVAPVELPGASSLFSPVVVEEERAETPRLVAIRDTPTAADSEDGVVARAKIPSWDEIMFGSKAPVADAPSDEEDYDNN